MLILAVLFVCSMLQLLVCGVCVCSVVWCVVCACMRAHDETRCSWAVLSFAAAGVWYIWYVLWCSVCVCVCMRATRHGAVVICSILQLLVCCVWCVVYVVFSVLRRLLCMVWVVW